ncbi:glutamine-dependent NAD(+) synthetase-like [Oppia nitens]|uniref:glutamine-dependent NAD(+) synthetase-like n=1 Tax=Oppia nitens TaxID=1686743 RepID=UPI0023DCB378|nr:glutamine-dependent NAD(+) synthetase-like [Oppia nitens]
MSRIGVAVCALNQLSLDFDGNYNRIIQSIKEAIDLGAVVRVGPELEIPGYGCEDAFYELDTTYHSWQVLAQIIEHDFKNIIIDIGMPIIKDSALYNCRVLLLNSQIVLIRPKTRLALNGNYRESRWFSAWDDGSKGLMTWYTLPSFITAINGQLRAPFGDRAVLELSLNSSSHSMATSSTFRIGFEICEELWHSDAQHINLFGQRGCHLILNSSASYWEIRKLTRVMSLMKTATIKSGGVYAFSNMIGCDGGGRLCFYGRSLVLMNGELLTMTSDRQNFFSEVQTAIAYIDPNDVTQYRLQNNIKTQTHKTIGNNLIFDSLNGNNYNNCDLDVENVITINIKNFNAMQSNKYQHNPSIINHINLIPEQEIMLYCSLWLWDYLRRCLKRGMEGFIVPLSGGLDSSSVVCLVYSLCTLLYEQIVGKNKQIIDYFKILYKDENIVEKIHSPQDICNKLLKCVYLSTRYSGQDSYDRALSLSQSVNCRFFSHNFDDIFKLMVNSVPTETKVNENVVTLQQQNLQARLRMVLTYYMSEGKRLVLATGNVDEALVGYLTKYDCSSADLNPIGSISKNDLKNFMCFCKDFIPDKNNAINRIINAIPSAELTGEDQKDEEDLGLTYDELSIFGKLRRGQFGTYGPYGMFCKIWDERNSQYISSAIKCTNGKLTPEMIATKVKRFFTLYANNRHKQTVLTPALHSETYSPDDNRFDQRQFLFDSDWKFQFRQIDSRIMQINQTN